MHVHVVRVAVRLTIYSYWLHRSSVHCYNFVMSEIEKCLLYQECINRSVHLHESAHFIVQMTSQPVAVDCVNYSNF